MKGKEEESESNKKEISCESMSESESDEEKRKHKKDTPAGDESKSAIKSADETRKKDEARLEREQRMAEHVKRSRAHLCDGNHSKNHNGKNLRFCSFRFENHRRKFE